MRKKHESPIEGLAAAGGSTHTLNNVWLRWGRWQSANNAGHKPTIQTNFDNWQLASAHFQIMLCLFNFPCLFTFAYFKKQAVREAAIICPRPCKFTFDLLTLKVVFKSRVTWPTSVPILVFLGLAVLDLGQMYATDRRQTHRRQTCIIERETHTHRERERESW